MIENQPDTNDSLNHVLKNFSRQSRRSVLAVAFLGLLSIGVGIYFLLQKTPLLFGAGIPFCLAGLFYFRVALPIQKSSLHVSRAQRNGVSQTFIHGHKIRLEDDTRALRNCRTSLAILFALSLFTMVLSCLISIPQSLSGMSMALALHAGVASVVVLMTTFWLEIHANEFQKNLQEESQ